MGIFLIIIAIIVLLLLLATVGFWISLFFILIIGLIFLGIRYLLRRMVVM